MAKALVFLCFILCGIIFVHAQYKFDDVLLKFRKDYIDYKTKAIRNLDDSFFKVYNGLSKNLYRVLDPYFKNSDKWNKICSNKSKISLQESAENRLKNACRIIKSTIKLADPTINSEMISFYSGLLGSPTEFEDIADDVFFDVEDNMNSILPIYYADPKCAKPKLTKHLKAYTPAILAVGSKSLDNMYNIFHNASIASEKAANIFNAFTLNYNKCVRSKDPSKCIKDLVSICS